MNAYIPPTDPTRTRAPCPGLNALANHGYISRSGTSIPFLLLLDAILSVYNLSLPLALLLMIPGFLLYGRFSLSFSSPSPSPKSEHLSPLFLHLISLLPVTVSWTIDLASTSSFGLVRVAHTASFMHPNVPSHAPDPAMFEDFERAAAAGSRSYVTRADLAAIRVRRERGGRCKLSVLHEQIALGESGLLWELFKVGGKKEGLERVEGIPLDALRVFLVDERLPEGIGKRKVSLLGARKVGDEVRNMMLGAESGV